SASSPRETSSRSTRGKRKNSPRKISLFASVLTSLAGCRPPNEWAHAATRCAALVAVFVRALHPLYATSSPTSHSCVRDSPAAWRAKLCIRRSLCHRRPVSSHQDFRKMHSDMVAQLHDD